MEEFYNQYACNERRRDYTTLAQLLSWCSQQFSTVYAVFDAVDECHEAYHPEIIELFGQLEKFGLKLLISGRPGFPLTKLQNTLRNSKSLDVRANESDLENYVASRVENGKLRVNALKLIKKVDGM